MNVRKFLMLSAFALTLAGPALAQDAITSPGATPRVNQVDQRLQDQQNRIDKGLQDGTIASTKRAAADQNRDARISAEASKDEAANNGHLTKVQQAKINRQLNRNSGKIYTQRHNQTVKPKTE